MLFFPGACVVRGVRATDTGELLARKTRRIRRPDGEEAFAEGVGSISWSSRDNLQASTYVLSSVCLFVCQQDYAKSTEPFRTKLVGLRSFTL